MFDLSLSSEFRKIPVLSPSSVNVTGCVPAASEEVDFVEMSPVPKST